MVYRRDMQRALEIKKMVFEGVHRGFIFRWIEGRVRAKSPRHRDNELLRDQMAVLVAGKTG